MILVSQVGLAFHYRLGSLNTGVQLNDLKTSTTDTSLDVLMKLTRIGSASFWGTRVVRLVSESGKVVYSTTKEIVVYKTLTVRERINRKKIPTGTYRLETEFITGNRKDVENTSLIQAQPLRVSNPVTVP